MDAQIEKAGPNTEDNATNEGLFKIRPTRRVNVDKANRDIQRFWEWEKANPPSDPYGQNRITSRAFSVNDVMKLIEANPGCEHLRVYHAFTKHGGYRMYMAADECGQHWHRAEAMDSQSPRATHKSYGTKRSAIKSCCPCNPCFIPKRPN